MQPRNDTFIAPGSYQQSSGPSKKLLLIAGGLGVAIFAAVLLLLSAGGDSTAQLTERLTMRLQSIVSITDDGDDNITDTSLRHLNSEIRATLMSDIAAISTTTTFPKKPTAIIAAEESEAAALKALEEAKIDGTYNDTYRKIISQRLQASAALASEIHSKTSNPTSRAILESHFENISILRDRLADSK